LCYGGDGGGGGGGGISSGARVSRLFVPMKPIQIERWSGTDSLWPRSKRTGLPRAQTGIFGIILYTLYVKNKLPDHVKKMFFQKCLYKNLDFSGNPVKAMDDSTRCHFSQERPRFSHGLRGTARDNGRSGHAEFRNRLQRNEYISRVLGKRRIYISSYFPFTLSHIVSRAPRAQS
jgi:hypothetical protein